MRGVTMSRSASGHGAHMAYCAACGHLNSDAARFCRACGAAQDVQMEGQSQPNTMAKPPSGAPDNSTSSNRDRKWLIGGGVALVGVVICCVLAMVYVSRKASGTPTQQN